MALVLGKVSFMEHNVSTHRHGGEAVVVVSAACCSFRRALTRNSIGRVVKMVRVAHIECTHGSVLVLSPVMMERMPLALPSGGGAVGGALALSGLRSPAADSVTVTVLLQNTV